MNKYNANICRKICVICAKTQFDTSCLKMKYRSESYTLGIHTLLSKSLYFMNLWNSCRLGNKKIIVQCRLQR